MKKIGLLGAMVRCARYPKMSEQARTAMRRQRLARLLAYARENSPYYAALYRDLPAHPAPAGLPPVRKQELMAHWDEWVTDRAVKLSHVRAFMEDTDNIGRKLFGKYMVLTTSGSTGNPLVMLCDNSTNNVMSAISVCRSYARKADLGAFMRRGGKSIGVFADGGFYLGNSSIRSRLLSMPWKKRQMALSSALLPIEEIVAQLNAFQPAMLGGYPSNLELLIDEQLTGRLHISPVIIMTGGEYLSDPLRKRLAEAFHCYVQTNYSCTEGGCVACECIRQHFHINDDWLIVEPVDSENRPVADGVLSHKILLTNLFNTTQPFIRYEITDRVIMHHEPCPCGNPSPWIEIEGRNDDIVILNNADGQPVRIPPLAIYARLKEVHALRRFQLVVSKRSHIELRIEPIEGIPHEAAFESACTALKEQLLTYGVREVCITRSSELPQQHPVSGKFKHIINM